jgi:hypothetical protein
MKPGQTIMNGMAQGVVLNAPTTPAGKPAHASFSPTDEQLAFLRAYRESSEDLIGNAGAGSAKTTTMELLARANPGHRFLYLCFNTKNAGEAEARFPRNVRVCTAHSLAYQRVGVFKHPQKLSKERYDFGSLFSRIFTEGEDSLPSWLTGAQYEDLLREAVKAFEMSVDEKIKVRMDSRVARIIAAGIIRQLKSIQDFKDDQAKVVQAYESRNPKIASRYSEFLSVLESIDRDGRRNTLASLRAADSLALAAFSGYYLSRSELGRDLLQRFIRQLEDHANRFFAIYSDLKSQVPFEHSTYLKLFQLRRPILNGYHTILFDERQDANPVMLDIVLRQTHVRKVWVGDGHQAIYGFNGAVNVDNMGLQGMQLTLTRSFRFGPNIADLANRVLAMKYRFFPEKYRDGSIIRIIGAGSGRAQGPGAILCRGNVGVLKEALANLDSRIYFDDCLPFPYLMSMLDIWRLRMEIKITNPRSPYFDYKDLSELKSEAELRSDIDTTRAIALLETMGPEKFKRAVEQLLQISGKTQEENADIHILTAHKAKGLEWPDVVISDDFLPRFVDKEGMLRKEVQEEEINLLYVAVTRAKVSIELPFEISAILGG